MIVSVISLALLFATALGISRLFARSVEACLPLSYCGVICLLYCFYCVGAIRIGLAICILLMFGVLIAGWRKAGSAKSFFRRCLSPGMAVYLGLCLMMLVFLSANSITRHDELRLWGAVPKAIYKTGKLQLGKDAPIFSIMQSYPPAFPLLGVFFNTFSREFSEGSLYIAYTCMAYAFFIPGLASWSWKNRKLLAPVWLLLLLTPCFFTSHFGDIAMFGMTLFIDPMLGILSGYVFFLAGRKPFRDRFSAVEFCLSLAVLCLCKSTGIVFAASAAAVAWILNWREYRPRFLLSIGGLAFGAGSWKLLLALNDVHGDDFAFHRLSKTAVENVLHWLVSKNMVAHGVPLGFFLSFVSVFLILWLLYILVSHFQKEQSKKECVVAAVAMLLSTAAFIYGYALIYGETMESFERYMATPILCVFTYILLSAFLLLETEAVERWLKNRGKFLCTAVFCGCIVCGVAFFAVWRWIFPEIPYLEAADQDALLIQESVCRDLKEDTQAKKIYLVIAGDNLQSSLYHHRIYFDLLSEEMYIGSWYWQSQVVSPEIEDSLEEWVRELKLDYDYVYMLSVEDAIKPVFAELSEDVPEAHTLYRVVPAANAYGIGLERV